MSIKMTGPSYLDPAWLRQEMGGACLPLWPQAFDEAHGRESEEKQAVMLTAQLTDTRSFLDRCGVDHSLAKTGAELEALAVPLLPPFRLESELYQRANQQVLECGHSEGLLYLEKHGGNGDKVGTGLMQLRQPHHPTVWTGLGLPNFYKRDDPDNLESHRTLLTVQQLGEFLIAGCFKLPWLIKSIMAIAQARVRIVKEPHSAAAYNELAYMLRDIGDFRGAIEQQQACISVDPADWEHHCFLGSIFEQVGAFSSAVSAYRYGWAPHHS